jgi:hypothetical protein
MPYQRGGRDDAFRELLRKSKPTPAGRKFRKDEPPEPPAALAGNPVRPVWPPPGLSAAAAVPIPAPEPPPVDAIARA